MNVAKNQRVRRAATDAPPGRIKAPAQLSPPIPELEANQAQPTGSATRPIRVMLISNHAIFRSALRLLIEKEPGMKVVREAPIHDGSFAAHGQAPDVILVDLDSNSEPCFDFLSDLLREERPARVLIFTGSRRLNDYPSLVRMGVMGVIGKEKPPELLFKAIRKVYAGEIWLDRSVVTKVLQGMSPLLQFELSDSEAGKIATLTKREREVIALFGIGLNCKRVAERLFISETTVRHHLTSIFEKLEVRDRFELVFYAYHQGLATPPV